MFGHASHTAVEEDPIQGDDLFDFVSLLLNAVPILVVEHLVGGVSFGRSAVDKRVVFPVVFTQSLLQLLALYLVHYFNFLLLDQTSLLLLADAHVVAFVERVNEEGLEGCCLFALDADNRGGVSAEAF